MFKGFRFVKARTVVPLPVVYPDVYIKFGRICPAETKGAVRTEYTLEGQPVFAKPVKLKGHSLTNMAYGSDGRVYLLKDGRCYSTFVKSPAQRDEAKRLKV